jgi:hypothetical protein
MKMQMYSACYVEFNFLIQAILERFAY